MRKDNKHSTELGSKRASSHYLFFKKKEKKTTLFNWRQRVYNVARTYSMEANKEG